MSLPAELEALEQQYAEFFESYQSGALSEADLRSTVENLIAVDGNGARWKLNLDGEGFLRAWPGGSFTPAHAEEFAPLSVPATTPLDHSDAFSWQTPPGQIPEPRPGTYAPREIDPAAPQYSQPAEPSRASRALHGASMVRSRWAALPVKRRRVVLVGAACVLLLLALAARGGSDDAVVEDVAGPVGTVVPSEPTSTAPTPEDTTVPPATDAPVPTTGVELSTGRVQEVLAALTSGDRLQIFSVLVDPSDPPTFWRRAALWSGVNRIGLSIDTSAVPVPEADRATQVWTIIDTETGSPVLTAAVDWIFDGSTWKLATFPTIAAV